MCFYISKFNFQDNLDRKGIDVPDTIEILPTNQEILSGPDIFDSILLEDKVGTQGTQGTVLEGVHEGTTEKDEGLIVKELQETDAEINPENDPTHTLEASPPSPQFSS